MSIVRSTEQEQKNTRRRSRHLVAVIVSGLGVLTYLIYSLRYGVGTLANPGPGIWPRAIALGLAASYIVRLAERHGQQRAQRSSSTALAAIRDRKPVLCSSSLVRLAVAPAAVIALMLLSQQVGFIPAASGASFTVMAAAGVERWFLAAFFSVTLAVCVAALVGGVLRVPLPPDFG